jgi:hypothetical protein
VDSLQNANALHAAERAAQDPMLSTIDTDVRFLRLFAAAMNTTTQDQRSLEQKRLEPTSWKSQNGKAMATIVNTEKTFSLAFDQRSEPGFAEFVTSRLDELYSSFLSQAKPAIE